MAGTFGYSISASALVLALIVSPERSRTLSPMPRANLYANFIPDPTNFGNVRVGGSHVRDALIASDGQSPVIVSQVGLQDPTLGFRLLNPFASFHLSPGESRLISIEFAPGESGHVQTRFFAMTNVPGRARMEIQVMGNGEFAE